MAYSAYGRDVLRRRGLPKVGYMAIEELLLPGVGLRYEFVNHRGARVGVIALRSGGFEVSLYEGTDPDLATSTFHLDPQEADALAQILGAPRISERFADLTREVPDRPRDRSISRPVEPTPTVHSETQGSHPHRGIDRGGGPVRPRDRIARTEKELAPRGAGAPEPH